MGKECYCDFGQINPLGAKKVEIFVRNGDREICVGDVIGGRTVLEIHAYGRKLDCLGSKMTAKLVLDGMPLFTIKGPYQCK